MRTPDREQADDAWMHEEDDLRPRCESCGRAIDDDEPLHSADGGDVWLCEQCYNNMVEANDDEP